MNSPKYLICKAKGGIENCSRHKELFLLQNEIKTLTNSILIAATQDKLDFYVELKDKQGKLDSIIGVAEYNDLNVSSVANDNELIKEMKNLISKRIDRIPLASVNWTDYVKAAVTFTSAQSYGSKVESMYIKKRGFSKVQPSEERGDAYDDKTSKHMEIKFTAVSSPDYRANIVQIRPHHDLDEYHILIFNKDTNQTQLYVLSKHEIAEEIKLTGSQLAHGTKSNHDASNKRTEYAIRFNEKSDTHKRWQKYRQAITWS